mgnify:FL=1|tara:strand:- start:657 stop:911 length:255 start_codon:yes stop_codon:yes gene_type:complete
MKDLNKQRIFWHSRRGMLELDLLLIPFVQDVFDDLPIDDQTLYRDLLALEDQDIYGLLMGPSHSEHAKYAAITSKILAHSKDQR